MAKNKDGGATAVAEAPVVETTEAVAPQPNHVLTYRREHPGNRCSYGIAGNSGIVVFDKGLFAGSDQPGFQAPPTITLDCVMSQPKADNKTAKAEAAAAKLADRAAKADAKVKAAQAKALERQQKAEAAAAAAKAKVDAATAAAAAKAPAAPTA